MQRVQSRPRSIVKRVRSCSAFGRACTFGRACAFSRAARSITRHVQSRCAFECGPRSNVARVRTWPAFGRGPRSDVARVRTRCTIDRAVRSIAQPNEPVSIWSRPLSISERHEFSLWIRARSSAGAVRLQADWGHGAETRDLHGRIHQSHTSHSMKLQTHIYLQARTVRGVQPEGSERLVHRQAEEPVSRAQTAKSARATWECTARGDREKKRKKFIIRTCIRSQCR